MQNRLFEAALALAKPWYVRRLAFDAAQKTLTIDVDFVAGARFAAPGMHQRAALARRADERCRPHDPRPFRRHRGLGADPPRPTASSKR